MINIDTAEGFIRKNGTEIERARLSSILGSMFDTQKALSLIQSLQNKDGGFSLVKDRESNISDTGFILTWLSDLKALHSNIAEKAIVYLESLQNKNGSWNETLPTTIQNT
jgi:prenyltransferase beta subunit